VRIFVAVKEHLASDCIRIPIIPHIKKAGLAFLIRTVVDINLSVCISKMIFQVGKQSLDVLRW
jgi:hypothetical protein